MGKNFILQQ